MKIKIFTIITLLIFFVISCNNEIQEKSFHENGNLKSLKRKFKDSKNEIFEEYDSLENLTSKGYYTNGVRDSLFGYNINKTFSFKKRFKGTGTYSKEYDNDGNLEREGIYIYDTIKADWWSFYKNRKLIAKRQYEIVCDDYYLNQIITFNSNRDTVFNNDKIFNASTFFKLNKVKKEESFILFYDVKSLFVNNKLELVILKNNYCSEEPDTVVQLKSNRGYIVLKKKYSNRQCFFFDYNIYKDRIQNHKKYFDLSNY